MEDFKDTNYHEITKERKHERNYFRAFKISCFRD